MPNRTAKFVSVLFASFLAGAPVMATSDNATPAADDCLAGPKGQTPEGGHWYYRIDHTTRRHCWYLADEHDKLSQSASPNTPAAKLPSPKTETEMQNSIADAHAELPAQTRIDGPASVVAPAPAVAVDATAATQSLLSQRSIVATRWPQTSGISPSVDPAPAPVNVAAAAPPDPPPPSRATPSSAVTPAPAVTLAAADAPPEKQSRSIQMLLVVILGALPLAGVMASVIFRFGSNRKAGRRGIRNGRRDIWGSIDKDHAPWAPPNPKASRRSVDLDRAREAAEDPSARIEQMLAQLSRKTSA